MYILLFRNYPPLDKLKLMLCVNFVIGPVVLEKKMKVRNFYENNDDNNNDGQRTYFDK